MRSEDVLLNKLKVRFKNDPVADIPAETTRQMELFRSDVKAGKRIAITVGSRGIANISTIIKAVCDALKTFGARPFIVPAMGSHGGATAEGQKNVLAEYGVTEEAMGAPVLSSMAVEKIGALPGSEGLPLYMDKNAYEADAVFVVNRVKAHTDFHADNESGIAKMLSIGLGKHAQALVTHGYLLDGLKNFTPRIAEAIVATGKILGALAIVEDGYDQISILRGAHPRDIVRVDSELLKISKSMMPTLPFENIHLLLVDWMGKNISGTGMDPNVIGRIGIRNAEDGTPRVNTICLFDITPESHGNALGIGLADLVPQSLTEKVDWRATYENVCTSRFLCRGATPVTLPTDRDVVDVGLSACGHAERETLRLVRIKDTLHIDEIWASDPMLDDIKDNLMVGIEERGVPLQFGEDGALKKLS
ncbi:MAG: DUF362 domain-containing protein [Synergistaceae bacterium]|nr:DUF362 domain-containing protein [Synergistaceae bacterium]